jgi:hypothetical protein
MMSLPNVVLAANHYIRAGATGVNNGINWTDAYTSLPSTLVRGDTYYIADGDYPSYTVDNAVSGTSYITIKKATTSDHGGMETGWVSTYGDGQAIFPSLNIITSYIIFDGTTGAGATQGVNGSGSNPDNYGFKLVPSNCSQHNRLLCVPPPGYSSTLNISDVTISHVAIVNCGSTYDSYEQQGIYSFPLSATNVTITSNYIKNNSTNMLIRKWSNSTITNNYFDANWYTQNYPSVQQISPGENSDDIILSNNIFKDTKAYVVGAHKNTNGLGNNRWKVFNNIMLRGNCVIGSADSQTSTADPMRMNIVANWEVHHNNYVDCSITGSWGAVFVGQLSDVATKKSYAYNNLFYNSSYPRLDNIAPTYTANAIEHEYNAYFNCTAIYDSSEGGTAQVGVNNPFVNSGTADYGLIDHTNPGVSLGAPFDKDFRGVNRNTDGIVDRGVFEYAKIPSKITTLTIGP